MMFFHRFGRRHHDHGHHHHHGHHGFGWGADFVMDRLMAKASRRLDLNPAQQLALRQLLELLQQQREALKGGSARKELADLLGGASFDRAAAQSLWDDRMQALRDGGPVLIAAIADFFDTLDADQQQLLRFMLRPRRFGMC
nr:Spy/CpxP family protein refolding chaperone [uncultured Roseateles sp.]